jgi:hypothetical protein
MLALALGIVALDLLIALAFAGRLPRLGRQAAGVLAVAFFIAAATC